VWITAFLASDWWPRWSGWVWLVLDVLGFVGTWLIVFGLRPAVTMSPASRGLAWRIFALWLSLIPFAVVWLLLLAPVRGPQVAAFICTVAMLFLVVMGLWVETYSLVLLGFAVTGAVVVGYLQFPAHFNLWMALTGGGTVRNNYGGDADVTLTVGVANGSGVFTGVIDEIYHHTPTDNNTGVISLVKEGTGTQTLTGIHTYTGPTNINNGTLHIPAPGSIAGSPLVTVGPSGRLRGDSTVGELDIFGAVAPGNDVGTLTAGNTSFMNGSVYDWEMGADGVVNDILMILGDLNVDAISTLNLLDGGLSQLCTTGARPWQEFDVLHYAGTSSVPMGEVLGVQASMIDLDLFFGFDASQATVLHDPLGKRLYLTGLHAEPIPEPATLALLGLGALALRRRRRRR